MKLFLGYLFGISMLSLVFGSIVIGQDKPLQVVEEVDLERYAGTWYEIARLPNRFQDRCTGDVTATYTLLDNDQIKVVNRCRTEDGEFIEAEGRARLADKDGSASKLKVPVRSALFIVASVCMGRLLDHRPRSRVPPRSGRGSGTEIFMDTRAGAGIG